MRGEARSDKAIARSLRYSSRLPRFGMPGNTLQQGLLNSRGDGTRRRPLAARLSPVHRPDAGIRAERIAELRRPPDVPDGEVRTLAHLEGAHRVSEAERARSMPRRSRECLLRR